MGNYATCKKYTQKEKKSVHTSDEEPLFINCKKLCRYRNTHSRIWNVDECGIGDVPQPTAVVGITGECTFQNRSREKLQNGMIVSCMSAGGAGYASTHYFQGEQDQA